MDLGIILFLKRNKVKYGFVIFDYLSGVKFIVMFD